MRNYVTNREIYYNLNDLQGMPLLRNPISWEFLIKGTKFRLLKNRNQIELRREYNMVDSLQLDQEIDRFAFVLEGEKYVIDVRK